MRVLSLGIMDIRGDLEDMERTKRINQKTEKSKENRDIKGTRGNSKKVEGSKEKKEHRSRGFWENKRKKRTNKKIKNSKKIRKSAKNMKTWKSPHKRKVRPSKIPIKRAETALGNRGNRSYRPMRIKNFGSIWGLLNPPKKNRNRKPTKKVTLENSDQARGNGAWESRESEL